MRWLLALVYVEALSLRLCNGGAYLLMALCMDVLCMSREGTYGEAFKYGK
jgi:hypothetical protein